MKVPPTIVLHEFIGLKAKVAACANSSCTSVKGTVVNETRNTFVILQDRQRKTIVKDQATFHFTLADGTVVEIDGKVLVGKPEDRLKKRIRRRW
ncbi:MAG: ribonuclease P protein component 1 [Candidatus Bathyarchaeota archaeon]|nr:MAG: ribonuclease P protein component 1 [Candidatus Bathyarchaeota archaeon]